MNPRNRRAAAAFPIAVLMLVSAGCGGGEGAPGGGGGGGGGFQFPPTAVEVAEVTSGALTDVFETVGTLEAAEAVTIVAEIDGAVAALPFREGDPIERGALIARLDDAELAATLARAEAVRAQAQSTYDRVKRVVEQGAGTLQDLDDRAAALKVAEADVALARARLAKTRITAPFAGVTGPREVSPGAFVRAGQAITELAQVDLLEVRFSVPERYAGELRRGAAVTVSTTAYPGYELEGRIYVVDPNLDPGTRSVRVIARIGNPDGRFRPGMSANVRSVLAAREDALTVPSEAVYAEGEQFFVYVIQPDSTVMPAPLQLGVRLAGSVEVVGGLEAGARVVRAGHQKLFPGAKVFAVNSGGAPGGGPEPGGAPGGAPEAGPAAAGEDAAADTESGS